MGVSDERAAGAVEVRHQPAELPAIGWLTAKRAHRLWIGMAIVVGIIFLTSLPAYVLELNEPLELAALDRPTRPPFALALIRGLLSIAAVVMCFTLAVILFHYKRQDRVALLASFLLLFYGIVSAGPLEKLALYNKAWDGMAQRMLYVGAVPWVVFFSIFPSGHFVPHWSRWLPGFAVIWALVLAAFHPFSTLGSSPLLPLIELLWILSVMSVTTYVQIWRYRHVSSAIEREQTRWIVFGLLVASALFTTSSIPWVYVQNQPAGTIDERWVSWLVVLLQVIWMLMLCVLPLTMTVAVLRYRLWDIDVILHRTLVYTIMSAIVIGLYVLIVGLLGAAFQARGHILISLLATAVVAMLFHPLRERVQRGVSRLLYGERDEPYVVLGRLAERLEAVIAAQYILPTIVETVADALKLPYVAIALRQGDHFAVAAEAARKPVAGEQTEVLPLIYQAETIGQLMLAPRALSEPFSQNDRRLLETIARQAGIAAHNVRLTHDLQRSREHLVTAREEERRRLRRDLHDGLGPALAAMSFKLDAAANLMDQNQDAARACLTELKAQIQSFLSDIRQIAYNLRPPALDELGLVGALHEHITSFQSPGLKIILQAPDTLPPLAAAVEVAAYRIALEALNNVQQHAEARQCTVRLALSDKLRLEIRDNGRGIPKQAHPGVGLVSMQERAAELGGTCMIESRPDTGTRILVQLPLIADGQRKEATWNASES